MSDSTDAYKQIQLKLHRLRQKQKKFALFSDLLLFLTAILAFSFFLLDVDILFRAGIFFRVLLVFIYILFVTILLAIFFVRSIYPIYFRKLYPDDEDLAIQVGQAYPIIKDSLIDAVQVYRSQVRDQQRTSTSLARATIQNLYQIVNPLDFGQIVSPKNVLFSLKIFCLILVGFFSFIIFSHRAFDNALNRMIHPRSNYPLLSSYELMLHPGYVRLIRGDDVEISVTGKGNMPLTLDLFLREEGEIEKKFKLFEPFVYRILSVKKSFDYFVKSGNVKTPVYRIEVITRPIVRSLVVKLTPPVYSKIGTITQEPNIGEIEALKGTSVEISAEASKNLSNAYLVFDQDNKIEMVFQKKNAVGYFIINKKDRYHMEISDTSGLSNINPILYDIDILPDLFPFAHILSPAENIDLDEGMSVPLEMEGEDDYGISSCRLGYWLKTNSFVGADKQDTVYIPLPLDKFEPREVHFRWIWDLHKMELFPEDEISYFFEVFDNDRILGPKNARSSTYTVRFPSIGEILEEVEKEQSGQIDTMEEVHEESRSIQEKIEQLSEEMKQGKDLDWEEKENIGKILEDQKQIQNKIDNLKSELNDLVDKMERNYILKEETLEKYKELQKLYDEIVSPELKDTLKKLQELLNQFQKENFKKGLENFKLSQEAFLQSIERTISLLKRLRIEEKMDELIKRIENLTQRQENVNQKLFQGYSKDLPELKQAETKIGLDTQKFREEMNELAKNMEELSDMPIEDLIEATDWMDRQNVQSEIKEIQKKIESFQMGEAGSQGEELSQIMKEMTSRLNEINKKVQENNKKKIVNSLRRISNRLINLSQSQESLIQDTHKGNISNSQAAQNQLSLLSGLNQMADSLMQLSRDTFFITSEIGRPLGKAQTQMKETLKSMEQSDSKGVQNRQGKAMGSLNQTVLAIEDVVGQISNGQSGLGMEQFFLQLEQMGQEQMAINNKLQDLLQKGNLALEEQAAMSRLAAEQGAVKKQLEKLLEEFGNRSEITGRLDQLAEEMESIIEELKEKKASPETIRRQEQILSHLLDAQHSLRRKDFSRERQAVTGKDIKRKSPDIRSQTIFNYINQMQRDVLRMDQEGYSSDFQVLIRQYFENLAKEMK